MLRNLMTHEGKLAHADCKATAACKTGMGVVVDRAAKTFSLPSSATGENIYLVYKARIPTGIYASKTDFSDYFEQFNEIASGELAPLYMYEFGEVFATDQYDATALTDNSQNIPAVVGTDGKWTAAASGTSSKFKFVCLHNDAGHTLAKIEVLSDAVTAS